MGGYEYTNEQTDKQPNQPVFVRFQGGGLGVGKRGRVREIEREIE